MTDGNRTSLLVLVIVWFIAGFSLAFNLFYHKAETSGGWIVTKELLTFQTGTEHYYVFSRNENGDLTVDGKLLNELTPDEIELIKKVIAESVEVDNKRQLENDRLISFSYIARTEI